MRSSGQAEEIGCDEAERQRREQHRGQRLERGLLVAYALSSVAAAALIYASM